ncbi:MAG: chemotaxis-specific protein-glutamate methyltransferase CheB [Vampirovibrionales bacterium]|nr:chemotaxis-specific protein-glutamate methyltransferase CheB [Vampirovibrionales bacterium]
MTTTPNTKPLNVLIVDDTVTYRAILKETLSGLEGINPIASAKNGLDALEKMAACAHDNTPIDMVLLDVEMPIMNGMETLHEIRKNYPKVQVVMVSGVDPNSANVTFRALESGALDFVAKPSSGSTSQNIQNLRDKLYPLFRHVQHSIATLLPAVQARSSFLPRVATPNTTASKPLNTESLAAPSLSRTSFCAQIVAIGVSTGGPNALKELLPKLPANLGVPVVIVIHMPEVFTGYLADSLNRSCALTVKEAVAGELLEANTVYIAPGGRHMTLERHNNNVVVATNLNAPENSCRPAVDVLFRSLPSVHSSGILNIVLTGMGSDGAKGIREIRKSPGHKTLTQSAESCVVYGMPKAVDDAGLSDESVTLNELANKIIAYTKHSQRH